MITEKLGAGGVGAGERRRRLLSLLRALVDAGILGASVMDDVKDPERFDARFKVQKYVYLARFFGYDTGHTFNLYMRGPYSPDLADDYYDATTADLDRAEPARLDPRYVELLRAHRNDEEWLEIASTVAMFHEDEPGLRGDELIGAVRRLKPWASEDYVSAVAQELDAVLN